MQLWGGGSALIMMNHKINLITPALFLQIDV